MSEPKLGETFGSPGEDVYQVVRDIIKRFDVEDTGTLVDIVQIDGLLLGRRYITDTICANGLDNYEHVHDVFVCMGRNKQRGLQYAFGRTEKDGITVINVTLCSETQQS